MNIRIWLLGIAAAFFSPMAVGQLTPGEWEFVFGSNNVIVPFSGNLKESVGNPLQFFCDSGFTASPATVASAPQVWSGIATGPVGLPGAKITCGYMDKRFNTTTTFPIVIQSVESVAASQPASAGDPVSTASGEVYGATIHPDLGLGGPLPLEFRHAYASLLNANGIVTTLGRNWVHNFEGALILKGSLAEVVAPEGKEVLFQQSGSSWQLVAAELYDYQLVTTATDTYQFLDPLTNLIYTFTGTGSALGTALIQDRNGNTLTLSFPSIDSVRVADGLGRTLTGTYDLTIASLTKVVDQTGRSVAFSYADGNLAHFTDANGNVRSYAYTTANTLTGPLDGLLISETLPLGNTPYTETFNSTGSAVTQTDSRKNVTTFAYDQPAGSTVEKDPLGNATTYASLNYADFSRYTDPDKQSFAIAYDSIGRRTSVSDRLGNPTSRTYHNPSGYVASETNAAGNTTSYTWTAQTQGSFTFYNLTKIHYADGASASFTYNASGNAISATDQAGQVWLYTYNSRGQRTSLTDPMGRATTYAYNAFDATLASVTDAAGNVTAYSYDALKRVNRIQYADGTTRSFIYDNLDNLLTGTDERGNVTSFTRNANNKLQSATDPLGKSSSIGYNTDENVSKGTDRTGASASYAYDQNQLLSSVTMPASETYTFTHDTHLRLLSVLDPGAAGSTFAYDKEDVLASVTDPLSRKTSFTTDSLGYRTGITTPLGESYTIARDGMERVTAATDPTGIATSVTYDPRGLVTGITSGGLQLSFGRDSSGLLTGLTDPNGNAWSLNYDAAGRLGSLADPLLRSTTYAYDQRDRIIQVQTPVGAATLTYDPHGNLLGLSYADGTNLQYTYDNDNRLLTGPGVTLSYDAEGRITGSNGLTITRDGDGRITSITYAPGKTVTYTYNSVGLLGRVTDWVSGSTTFTYDAAHEVVATMRPNGLATHVTYDGDGRIAAIAEDAGSSIAIARDAAGRIVSETRTQPQAPALTAGVLPLAFDAADQVAGSTYDGMGRLTADPQLTYTWDMASRLTSYQGANGAAAAGYDGLTLRTSQTSAAGAGNFVWNYATGYPTVATVQSAGADQRYYVYTPGGTLLYAIDAAGNARHFYHFDETGSTVLLTNDAGAVTDSYGITPYGETVTQNGTTTNPFTWLGRFGVMQEGSTGLYYMRARWYDSTTARFLSPAPLLAADPRQVNPYAYAREDPLGVVDPDGTGPSEQDPGLLSGVYDLSSHFLGFWAGDTEEYYEQLHTSYELEHLRHEAFNPRGQASVNDTASEDGGGGDRWQPAWAERALETQSERLAKNIHHTAELYRKLQAGKSRWEQPEDQLGAIIRKIEESQNPPPANIVPGLRVYQASPLSLRVAALKAFGTGAETPPPRSTLEKHFEFRPD